ncbi:hypothetical protein ACFQJ8_21680 [Halocatena marina]
MIVIVILTIGMILLAQGLDRIFNPRIRARHKDHEENEPNESEESAPGAPVN